MTTKQNETQATNQAPQGATREAVIKALTGAGVKYESAQAIANRLNTEGEIIKTESEIKAEERAKENREHCKRIAEELETIYNGNLYKCPDCYELEEVEEIEKENEEGETVTAWRFACGYETEEEPEAFTLYDYLMDGSNVLDISYTVDSERRYSSASICIAWGGPSIYINTDTASIDLYWWTDKASYYLDRDTSNAIDEIMEELYNLC